MQLLITGSSGYLGKSFIQSYHKAYQIQTYSLRHTPLENLSLEGVEVILHCAALVHQTQPRPIHEYHAINVAYPLALAQKAKEAGVKQFIFISTIAIYGEEYTYIDAQTRPNPATPYGTSKLEAEEALRALESDTFKVTIVRPPMIYGKDAPGNIHKLIQLIKKLPLLPFGGINNQRSFIYINNLTQLLHHLIQHQHRGSFLSADDHPISTSYLIRSLANALGRPCYLFAPPLIEGLIKRFKPVLHRRLYQDLIIDAQSTREQLGFQNPYSFEEAILKTTS